MGQKEADEWLALQSKRWEENFPGAPFADGKTVIGLLDRLAALEAERDALRADAERWKWAKHQGSIQDAIDSLVGDTVTISEMEAAIDAAIAADGAQP